jgi:hypothetical protein
MARSKILPRFRSGEVASHRAVGGQRCWTGHMGNRSFRPHG